MNETISSERIRALRKWLSLSQIDLAELLNVNNVTANRWEHDRADPTLPPTSRVGGNRRRSRIDLYQALINGAVLRALTPTS